MQCDLRMNSFGGYKKRQMFNLRSLLNKRNEENDLKEGLLKLALNKFTQSSGAYGKAVVKGTIRKTHCNMRLVKIDWYTSKDHHCKRHHYFDYKETYYVCPCKYCNYIELKFKDIGM